MKVNKHDNETQKIINKQFYLYVLISLIFLITSVLCFLTEDWELGLFVGALAILFFVLLLFTPCFFVFDSKKLYMHSIVFRKTIYYSEVTSVVESGLFETLDNLSKYEIMYSANYKGKKLVKLVKLPRNKSIKKQIERKLKGKMIP